MGTIQKKNYYLSINSNMNRCQNKYRRHFKKNLNINLLFLNYYNLITKFILFL